MAKNKSANHDNLIVTEAQKRREQYVDACNKTKKGKIAALSMIAVTVVCLLVLLIVSLKLNGTGLTVVGNNNTAATTVNSEATDTVE